MTIETPLFTFGNLDWLPNCKNLLKHLHHKLSVGAPDEVVDFLSNIVNFAELEQVHQAPFLQLVQLVQPGLLEPLEDVARVDVFHKALLTGVFKVGDVILVCRPKKRQAMLPEVLLLDGSVQVAEKGHTGVCRHVFYVDCGRLFLHEVVVEHALEHRRARRQDCLVSS